MSIDANNQSNNLKFDKFSYILVMMIILYLLVSKDRWVKTRNSPTKYKFLS
jgi:hypothetical protein